MSKIERSEIMAYLAMKIKHLVEVHRLISRAAPQKFAVGDIVTWTDSIFAGPSHPHPPDPMLVLNVFDPEPKMVNGQISTVMTMDVEVIGLNEDGVLTNVLTDSRFLEKYDLEKVINFIVSVDEDGPGGSGPMTIN